jgi:hypothetical protein
MTALLSSGNHTFLEFLTRTKSALLRFAKAIEKSRLRQIQREVEYHVRLHNTSLRRDDLGVASGIARRKTKPKSSTN